jgi:hypothetical protein
MGMGFRADRIIKSAGMTEERKEGVRRDLKRLAGREQGDMGSVYNVMAITSRQDASEGFGGLSFP